MRRMEEVLHASSISVAARGRLLWLLLGEKQFTEIVGIDVPYRVLETAKEVRRDRRKSVA